MGLSKIILNVALWIVDVLTFYVHPKKIELLLLV